MSKATVFICALIRSFPCFADRIDVTPETWDTDILSDQLGVFSSGERHAALFILCVWNPGYAESQGWKFDVLEAMGVWDLRHRAAFLNWAQNPYWP